MMYIKKAVCVMLLAMPALALAEGGKGCDLVNLGAEVLAKFPNALKGCQDVTEKNGGVYMHYVGKVFAADKDSVTVDMEDRSGKPAVRLKFAPAEGQTAKFEGKDTPYASLKKGTKLDFYIEHSKWGLYATPDGTRMTIISREDL